MHIAGCFRRSIIVPHLCHRLPPMLFIGRSGNTVDRSLTRWVRSWRPVPAARPFGQGGMLPRYPFIRLSMNPEDYFSPHPLFHTFFGFDSPSVGTFFRESPLTLYSTLFPRLDEKKYQTFLQKNGRHSLSFDNRIKKYLSRNFFRTKKKQKKKTGSVDSRRRTRETIRGATEKWAFSLLFFFCFSIYSFSCIVHIGGSW